MSWRPAESSGGGVGTTRVLSLARDPLKPSDIVAGTDAGVYRSQDAGTSWRLLGFGLPTDLHVGVVRILHPPGAEPLVLASVDQLYQYPGHWLLATPPWRGLAVVTVAVLALTLLALVAVTAWQLRRSAPC
jgi:hypothetical protein